MALPTPPLTPRTFPFSSGNVRTTSSPRWNRRHAHAHTPSISSPLAGPIEDELELPPPMPLDSVPELDMPEPSLATENAADAEENEKHRWRPGMSREEKDARESWIAGARGRSGLRIVIVTGELELLVVCGGARVERGRKRASLGRSMLTSPRMRADH